MFTTYILYSPSTRKFYVGQTSDLAQRLHWHSNAFFEKSFTSQNNDWELFLAIDCDSREEAIFIERYIKSMKSSQYYYNLKKYPDIISKIKEKFRGTQSR